MNREIRPLAPEDIPELGRFLAAGFHAPSDSDFAAPDVLRWKYLDPAAEARPDASDADSALSYIARDESGRIIGHLGLCRTAFEGRALAASGGRVGTIHIIDWLGSPEHRAVGMSLMRRAHGAAPTQFGLGVSQAALVVGERAGYELRSLVPAYTRVLRPGYWIRTDGLKPWQRALRLGRELATRLIRPPSRPCSAIVPRRVERFGAEIAPIVEAAKAHAIVTTRDPARLNAFLRFPRQDVTGWHLRDASGRLRGLAVLNVIPKDGGRTRLGKVVDCLMEDLDIDAWHAAFAALTAELARRGADLAQAYGSTPWAAEALGRSGYRSRFSVKFHIRDRQGIIPKDVVFHLTPMEGDYGYT